ncbi:acyl-ACP thioesterase domain-containing protein [Rhodococcus sp. Q]|uniref:acyl-[acyl-carrier-protein] thioesterase n=1 Tax=Rhodococcus sp. Q TaxID=2502252 RepID=UPI001484EE57|nr:acyl-ACP thioesterase domain-containing protein [Rhodococcus sp. Q]
MPFDQPLTAAPASATPFRTSRPLRTGDVAPDNRLRFDGIARYLQDIASDNADAAGFGVTDPVWILRRTVIDVHTPAAFPDRLHLSRWCSSYSTRWSNMRVQLTSDKGARIETEGFWINLNPDTGMPTRISDSTLELLATTTDESRLRWKAWLDQDAPAPDGVPDAAFPLRSTDLDPLGHVNNAAYLHAVEEHVTARPDLLAAPHRLVIEYRAPITAGEHLALRRRDDDESSTVWFVVNGESRATARMARL